MRKNLFYYLFAVLCTVTLLASCSDDDEPGNGEDTTKVLLESVIGTYSGELNVSVAGAPLEPINQKIFVEQDGLDKVKLSLYNFSIEINETPVEVGTIEISGIALGGDASNVVLEETTTTMQHETLGELDITISSGNIVNGKATLKIDVLQVDLSLNIKVDFEGSRISTDVDTTDYAKELAGWYAQVSLTATGAPDGFEMSFPGTFGIELVYAGYNKINVKSFPLSFPPKAQYIELENVAVEKEADGSLTIVEVKQNIADYQNKGEEVALVFSGTVKNAEPTLNISLKSDQYDISYVYVGEKKFTGNEIEAMAIAGDVIKVQPEIKDKEIVFFVNNGTATSQLESLVPTFVLSEGATMQYNEVEYVVGTPIDFSKEQKFTVISQKGAKKVFTVNYEEWSEPFETNLDEWEQQNTSTAENMKYYGPVGGWSSSNGGVEYLKNTGALLEIMAGVNPYSKDEPYAVLRTDDSKSGSAARLESLDTKGVPSILSFPAVPKVTSGSLFNGFFKVETNNTLKSTRFGAPCDKEPKSFTGSYKYTPGETYYKAKYPGDSKKANEVEVADIKDTPAMNAVLYEVDTYAFDYLDGTNLLSSDKVVAIASVKYDEAAEAGNYIDFNVQFEYNKGKSFDASKKYKLAIVCSSSKDGDEFSGAPGSVLYVDNLKVSF